MHVPPPPKDGDTDAVLMAVLLTLVFFVSGVAIVWLNATAAYPYGLR